MITIEEIIGELEGKETDKEMINGCLKKYGPKPVRVALLGIASQKRIYNPYWIGCPPTVFLSYKWNGPASKDYVQRIHDYLVNLGYKVHFDKNELKEDADAYTEVPAFISHVADCQYYVLVLTEKAADNITARNHRETWIFDEYQEAVTIVNKGRMFLVPLLIEEKGATDFFTKDNTICLVNDVYNFKKLDAVFYPVHFNIDEATKSIFADVLDAFDVLLVQLKWNEAWDFFEKAVTFKNFPDYQFRVLIYAICTLNEALASQAFNYCSDFTGNTQLVTLLNGYATLYDLDILAKNLPAFNIR
jgi:hypothetical protein